MRVFQTILTLLLLLIAGQSFAQEQAANAAQPGKLKVVTTFSVLHDMARQVGKDQIILDNIVGPDQDMHAYELRPEDMQKASSADVLIVNGLAFEPWLDELIAGSKFQGRLIVASFGAATIPLSAEEKKERDEAIEKQMRSNVPRLVDRAKHVHREDFDPHAWTNMSNGRIYVANIAKGLSKQDPANEKFYNQNAIEYRSKIQALEEWAGDAFRSIPENRRKMVTSHDSLGYLTRLYRIKYFSAAGLNTSYDVSAQDVSRLIDTIRSENITALFFENMVNPNVLAQIAKETGVNPSGPLYTDALSNALKNRSDNYLGVMQYNIETILNAMRANS